MTSDDNDFFVMVAGVLAAVVLVVSWWFVSGAASTAVTSGGTLSGVDPDPVSVGESDDGDSDESDTQAQPPAAAPETGVDTDEDAEGDEDAERQDAEESEPLDVLVASTVVQAIVDREDLSVLADLLERNGLDELIGTNGEWTIIAPTNDAFAAASADDGVLATIESAPVAILGYHVVAGQFSLDDLRDLATSGDPTLATLQGETLSIDGTGTDLAVNGAALSPEAELPTGNGTVHVVDELLLPPVASLNTLVAQDPILFPPGGATIDDASSPTLDRLIDVLERSDSAVLIGGHTDNSGDPLANQLLSEDRARAVLNYLVANGIDESRLQARGFGDSDPVADNSTEAGRARNRRIEFAPG